MQINNNKKWDAKGPYFYDIKEICWLDDNIVGKYFLGTFFFRQMAKDMWFFALPRTNEGEISFALECVYGDINAKSVHELQFIGRSFKGSDYYNSLGRLTPVWIMACSCDLIDPNTKFPKYKLDQNNKLKYV